MVGHVVYDCGFNQFFRVSAVHSGHAAFRVTGSGGAARWCLGKGLITRMVLFY